VLRGHLGLDQWERELTPNVGEAGSGLSVHWARGKIAALLDKRRPGAPDDEIGDAVLALALAHHLVTPYTSLVAIDITPVRPGSDPLVSHALKTNLPHGWDYTAVFGLGQGATDGPLNIAIGLTALLIAAGLSLAGARALKA
jgi:Ca-activated chloride channel family protein